MGEIADHPGFLSDLATAWDNAAHSLYGASGAHRYLHCAGSLIANALHEDTAGYDAAYGTVAHFVTETWRKTHARPSHLVGTKQTVVNGNVEYEIEIDEEMLVYCEMNYEETRYISGRHWIEERVDFSRLTPIPNQGGRADFIAILQDGKTMIVFDDKFGIAVQIFAYKNPQLMLYAIGALWKFDPENKVQRIVIRIGQPRLDHFDEWIVSRDDLMLFAGECIPAMRRAWDVNAPRLAGEHCTFCRAKGTCATYGKLQVDMIEGLYEAVGEEVSAEQSRAFKMRLDDDPIPTELATHPQELTTEQLVKIFPMRSLSEKFWKAVHHELMERTMAGNVPEMKVVEARSRRGWVAQDKVVAELKKYGLEETDMFETALRSPKQMENQLRTKGVRPKDFPAIMLPITHKPPGNPTLVKASDPRDPLVDTSALYQPVTEDDDDL